MTWKAGLSGQGAKELEALQAELERLLHEVNPEGGLEDTMILAVGMLHRYAAGIVHVDTGRLKNSLHFQTQRLQRSVIGSMGTNLNYSIYENARGGSHAFMDRTVREEGRRVIDLFRERIIGGGQ